MPPQSVLKELEDPFVVDQRDEMLPVPSIADDSPALLPSSLRRKLPTPSVASRPSEVPESEDFIMDLTSDGEAEPEFKQPKQSKKLSRPVTSAREGYVGGLENGTQTSEYIPDDSDGSDTDYQPENTKQPAKKSSKGPSKNVNNTTIRKPSPAKKSLAKAPAAKGLKTRKDSGPGATSSRQNASKRENPVAMQPPPEVEAKGSEPVSTASTNEAQSYPQSSTRNTRTQVLPKNIAPWARRSSTTNEPKPKPTVKRVAKKPFFPVSPPQNPPPNAEAMDNAYEVRANSPEPPTKDLPARSQASKSTTTSKTTNKKKVAPKKAPLKKTATQNIVKVEPAKVSPNKAPETEVTTSVGPNSKKKRSPVQYGLKSRASRRTAIAQVMDGADEGLAQSSSPGKRRMGREPIEKERSQGPPPAKLDGPSMSESDKNLEPDTRDDGNPPPPFIEDTQPLDDVMFDAPDLGNDMIGIDSTLPIEISSDSASDTTNSKESTPEDHLKMEGVLKPEPTRSHPPVTVPIDIQHVKNIQSKSSSDNVDDGLQTVQLNVDQVAHGESNCLAAETPVDQMQRKRQMVEVDKVDTKRAKTGTSSKPLPQKTIAKPVLDTSSNEHASSNSRHIRPAPSPRESSADYVEEVCNLIDPKTMQPVLDHQDIGKRSELFTIHEDLPEEGRDPSSRITDGLFIKQRKTEVPLPRVARSRATSSLNKSLGSPIRTQARNYNPTPAFKEKAPSMMTPLPDILHLPINGRVVPQEPSALSAAAHATTARNISTTAPRPRDRQEKATGADRLASTLYNVVDVSTRHD
ncbi:hypothetical protein SLS62_006132 [Diatrype stigma]|uniref:Uncharacterized protein n=1 Tax=Diatrype stigma TaxID=117547 RepID=A0AAN9URC9_9PEZI